MDRNSKIYVAGHTGLVGSALWKNLLSKGYSNIIGRSLAELDLRNQDDVDDFFKNERPEYVFLAAARVGGIVANNTYRADFIYDNIMIQSNIIHAAWKYKSKKLLFLGSTCIYPANAPQPLKEKYLLSGPLEQTNEPYAIAKIAGLKMCESYNRQYGTDFISVMPTNLYGPSDNFDLEKSHVLPAILRKMHLAAALENDNIEAIRSDLNKNPVEGINGNSGLREILTILMKYGITREEHNEQKTKNDKRKTINDKRGTLNPELSTRNAQHVTVTLWGSGAPLREFMYSEEMAAACVHIMENATAGDIVKLLGRKPDAPHFVNIGTGKELRIRDLAYLIKDITGFKGDILFDSSKPDGTMRKLTDSSVLRKLGFESKIGLQDGIKLMYKSYLTP